MKRTPLVRRTPLARGTKPLKKSRLQKSSKKKAQWEKLYVAQYTSDPEFVIDAQDGRMRPKSRMQRHHVARRLGKRILIYCYVQGGFHVLVENNVQQAMKEGWIRREGEGYKRDPLQPKPWYPGSLKNEHLLDA